MDKIKKYGTPRRPKFEGIKLQFGNLEGQLDHLILWNGNVHPCDRALVLTTLTSKTMHFDYKQQKPIFEDSFFEELEKRGYDLKTIKFSIEKTK